MTMPAEPPKAPEQVIEQRLVDCGLTSGGFTVKYEDYLQSIEIVITPAAGAHREHFSCIREAVEYEIVTFEDDDLQMAYSDYVSELLRPQMLENATTGLEKRGLLKDFPKRGYFPDLRLYAEALEEHSGVPPKSVLRVDGETIVFDPPRGQTSFTDFTGRYSDLIAVIMFAVAHGDFENFLFTGNQAVQPEGE